MFLSRTFCNNLGGEVKLDWSQATILIGNKKVLLKPVCKDKYTILPFEDPRSHILYTETNFAKVTSFYLKNQ